MTEKLHTQKDSKTAEIPGSVVDEPRGQAHVSTGLPAAKRARNASF